MPSTTTRKFVTLATDEETRDKLRALSEATGLQQKEIIRLLAQRATPQALLAAKAETVTA